MFTTCQRILFTKYFSKLCAHKIDQQSTPTNSESTDGAPTNFVNKFYTHKLCHQIKSAIYVDSSCVNKLCMPLTSEIYCKPCNQEVSESVVQLTNPIPCKNTCVFTGDQPIIAVGNHKAKSAVVIIITYYGNLLKAPGGCSKRTHRCMLSFFNAHSVTNRSRMHRGGHGSGRQPLTSFKESTQNSPEQSKANQSTPKQP